MKSQAERYSDLKAYAEKSDEAFIATERDCKSLTKELQDLRICIGYLEEVIAELKRANDLFMQENDALKEKMIR